MIYIDRQGRLLRYSHETSSGKYVYDVLGVLSRFKTYPGSYKLSKKKRYVQGRGLDRLIPLVRTIYSSSIPRTNVAPLENNWQISKRYPLTRYRRMSNLLCNISTGNLHLTAIGEHDDNSHV